MADQATDGRTLADKLDQLFRTVHPRGRGEYSYGEVAKAIEERGGPTVSATYIWQLRKGRRDNPTKRHLEALADFFDDAEAERIADQLALLTALRDAGARQIAARAAGLSEGSIQSLREMTDRLRELEGLPEPAPEQPAPEHGPQ